MTHLHPVNPLRVPMRLSTGRVLKDLLDACVAALEATDEGAPARRMVTVQGQAFDQEQLTVHLNRTVPQQPVGSRTPGNVHIPVSEVKVRVLRKWPVVRGQEPPKPEAIERAALIGYDDHDALLAAVEAFVRREQQTTLPWSDGIPRDCRMSDCTPLGASGDLRGWEMGMIIPFV